MAAVISGSFFIMRCPFWANVSFDTENFCIQNKTKKHRFPKETVLRKP